MNESVKAFELKPDPHHPASIEDVSRAFEKGTSNLDAGDHHRTGPNQTSVAENVETEESSLRHRKEKTINVKWLQNWCDQVEKAMETQNSDLPIAICSALLTTPSSCIPLLTQC